MGKHGPCYHCGVTSTPLWRNGPPEKPVLCNACGSRWRTKGTLENYTPLHARADADEFEDYRGISKVKTVSIKNKEAKVLKRKYDNHNNYNNNNNINEFVGVPFEYNQGYRKGFDEDTSNRSSSGSAISNSESCAQYGSNADISDLTGPSQAIVWDTMVPSRKRTCVTRSKPSPVEKLTRDLYTIWHEQQSSCLSAASSEEELLLESDKPMVSVEIGHGTVLIRHPSSIAREEESEASSLSIDNKIKKPANPPYEQHKITRDRCQLNELQIMAHHNSPLCYIDLQDIVNFDNFASHFTTEEQQKLLKFLPSIDTKEAPERDSSSVSSLKSMFNSPQLKENLLSYQKLVADGLFDNSLLSGLKTEDCRALKKFVLCNSTKSKWVEQYKTFKDLKGKNIIHEPEAAGESNTLATDSSLSVKRSRDGLHQKISGGKAIMKSPRRIMMMTTTSSYDDQKEVIIDKGLGCSFFTQKRVYDDDVDEHDLLLDVPSNGSFPQAELLPASTSSSSVYPNFVRP